jgi:hypothetical protein
VRSELVTEVKYLTWTDDNLLRQVVYEGLREDKPAAEVRRPVPSPKPVAEERVRLARETQLGRERPRGPLISDRWEALTLSPSRPNVPGK